MRNPSGKSVVELIKDVYFMYPTMEYRLRPLARAAGVSAPAAKYVCVSLLKEGFLVKKADAYAARHDDEKFRREKRLWNLGHIEQSGLIEALASALVPNAIILYGSYARGEDWEQSDIDLAIVEKKRPQPPLAQFEQKLGRKIQVVFVGDLKKDLLNNLVNGIVLFGRWDPL